MRRHYGAKLVVMNIGDTFTTGPTEAAFVINELVKPTAVIASHANEVATRGRQGHRRHQDGSLHQGDEGAGAPAAERAHHGVRQPTAFASPAADAASAGGPVGGNGTRLDAPISGCDKRSGRRQRLACNLCTT